MTFITGIYTVKKKRRKTAIIETESRKDEGKQKIVNSTPL
jgi:hypothetical protein